MSQVNSIKRNYIIISRQSNTLNQPLPHDLFGWYFVNNIGISSAQHQTKLIISITELNLDEGGVASDEALLEIKISSQIVTASSQSITFHAFGASRWINLPSQRL